jgi:hypothetical protein
MPGGNHRAGLFLDFFDITKSRSGKSFGSRAESPKHDSPRAAPWVKVIRMICRPEGAFQARAFFGLPLQGKCFWDDQTQGAALGYDEVALSARANARQNWFKILNVKARLNKYHA